MPSQYHDSFQRILDGSDKSARGQFLRLAMSLAEPFYATVMRGRNLAFERGTLASHSLGRPTVSIGNITTGGTGKTPVVSWLAGKLREAGRHPAVLLRGYKSTSKGISDEQQLLDRTLNTGDVQNIPVRANPNRIASGAKLLGEKPDVDVFILDDGFQHQKVRRDFNLVLINSLDPWGLGHVLPRGLLREPLSGLKRADAFLLTRCSLVGPAVQQDIRSTLEIYNPDAPVFCSDHTHTAIRFVATGRHEPLGSLAGQRFYTVCGIANPASLDMQMRSLPGEYVGHQWFPDHHDYTAADLHMIRTQARAAGATQILTTEKDWVKIAALPGANEIDPPIGVIELTVRFYEKDEGRLFDLIQRAIPRLDGTRFPPGRSTDLAGRG